MGIIGSHRLAIGQLKKELTSQNCPLPSAYVLMPPELTSMYQHTQLENISIV